MSVYLKLQPNEFADLLQLAQRERRDVRAQAAHMIHLALIDDAQKNPLVAGLVADATSGMSIQPSSGDKAVTGVEYAQSTQTV